MEEINSVVEKLNKNQDYVIAIDDARLFEGSGSGYPTIAKIKEFAAAYELSFCISDDIIVMKNSTCD